MTLRDRYAIAISFGWSNRRVLGMEVDTTTTATRVQKQNKKDEKNLAKPT